MSTVSSYRDQLTERLERNRAKRAAAIANQDKAKPCEHDWQTFRETIVPERLRHQLRTLDGHTTSFKGSSAHFVVRGCVKCHAKRRVDYVVSML